MRDYFSYLDNLLQPIITSTDKMAASSRFATVSEDDFALPNVFLFSFLK